MTKEAKFLILIGFISAILLILGLSACSKHNYNVPQTESPKAKPDSVKPLKPNNYAINIL